MEEKQTDLEEIQERVRLYKAYKADPDSFIKQYGHIVKSQLETVYEQLKACNVASYPVEQAQQIDKCETYENEGGDTIIRNNSGAEKPEDVDRSQRPPETNTIGGLHYHYHADRRVNTNITFENIIEKFDDNCGEWKFFKRIVTPVIVEAPDISPGMKESLIAKLLEGEPKKEWKTLVNREVPLRQVWEQLAAIYEDTSKVDVYLQELVLKMTKVKHEFDIENLMKLRNEVRQFCNFVETLGPTAQTQAWILCSNIANKLYSEEALRMTDNSLNEIVSRLEFLYSAAIKLILEWQHYSDWAANYPQKDIPTSAIKRRKIVED